MRYLLNGNQIDSPSGLDGLVLRKLRHPLYWGFLLNKLGYAEGLGSISFTQRSAIELLRSTWNKTGLNSSLSFVIEDGKQTPYSGYIDFSQYVDSGDSVSVGLRDDTARMTLSNGAATSYKVDTNNTMLLHGRRLSGAPSLTVPIASATMQKALPNAFALGHSIPISRQSQNAPAVPGTLLDVTAPKDYTPFYRNDTGIQQKLRISGIVRLTHSTSWGTTSKLQLRVGTGGDRDNHTTLGELTTSTTPTLSTLAVDLDVVVESGESMWLGFISETNVTSYTFAYDAVSTALSLSEQKKLVESTAGVISAYDLFRYLIAQTTGGTLSFYSDYFSSGEGASLFITNGANLRGVNRSITSSLQDLFTKLNAIECLALDVTDEGVVLIEPKVDLIKRRGRTVIKNILSFREVPALDWTFSDVSAGYTTWQGESGLSNNEVNASRQYTTDITTVRKPLDLSSSLIASATLIEEQRIKQFDQQSAASDRADNFDESLFILCGVLKNGVWENERTENLTELSGLTDDVNPYNIRLTPSRNLAKWAPFLVQSGKLTLTSSTGNLSVTSTYKDVVLDESATFSGITPLIGQADKPLRKVSVETPLSMLDYLTLGDEMEANGTTGLLMEAAWRPTNTGIATLTFYC